MTKERNIFLTTCQESLLRPLAESHRETIKEANEGRQKRDADLRPMTQHQAVPDN